MGGRGIEGSGGEWKSPEGVRITRKECSPRDQKSRHS